MDSIPDFLSFCRVNKITENPSSLEGGFLIYVHSASGIENYGVPKYNKSVLCLISKKIDRGTGKSSGFRLLINGISISQWFKQKYDEFRKALEVKPKQKQGIVENKGIKV